MKLRTAKKILSKSGGAYSGGQLAEAVRVYRRDVRREPIAGMLRQFNSYGGSVWYERATRKAMWSVGVIKHPLPVSTLARLVATGVLVKDACGADYATDIYVEPGNYSGPARVDYARRVTPEGYVCKGCGLIGCKLWRGAGEAHADLCCAECAERHERPGRPADWMSRFRLGIGDEIGWFLPAVPTGTPREFHAANLVPEAGVKWWRSLPTSAREVVSTHVDCGSFHPGTDEDGARCIHCKVSPADHSDPACPGGWKVGGRDGTCARCGRVSPMHPGAVAKMAARMSKKAA